MQRIAIYPGTFNPLTNGHVDLIERAAKLFERVIVAIATSERKSPILPLELRVSLAQQVLADIKNVEVCSFDCLIVDFAKQKNANILMRGLRAVTDFDYEFQLAGMNRVMMPELETIFLTPAEQHTCISSTMIREIVSLGGDVSKFVPSIIADALRNR